MSIVREITEQKRADARLRSSEDRYALATSAGGVGVWDWDVETDRVYVDPVALTILGHPEAGRPGVRVDWRQLVHPDDRDIALAASTAYMQGRADKYDVELRMLHLDGSIRWFHTIGSVVRRADGTIYRMIGTFTDVTDRKRADDALLDREATLRESYGQIQDLAGRLIVAQETERKRLARELHDDLSQQVSLMAIEVDQLRQTAPDFADHRRRVADYAAGIASSVHQLSHRLHPFKLEALGLVSAVASVCVDIVGAAPPLRRVPARSGSGAAAARRVVVSVPHRAGRAAERGAAQRGSERQRVSIGSGGRSGVDDHRLRYRF